MAWVLTGGWGVSRSDMEVIGNLIKSSRDPVWKGSTAHSHCLGLNSRQGDFLLTLAMMLSFVSIGFLLEMALRKMFVRRRAKPSQDNLFFQLINLYTPWRGKELFLFSNSLKHAWGYVIVSHVFEGRVMSVAHSKIGHPTQRGLAEWSFSVRWWLNCKIQTFYREVIVSFSHN